MSRWPYTDHTRSPVENIEDTWCLTFTDKLLATIVTATNREGYQVDIEGERFKQTTLSEIHALLDIICLHGIYQATNKPTLEFLEYRA